jgi:hypothetical protein
MAARSLAARRTRRQPCQRGTPARHASQPFQRRGISPARHMQRPDRETLPRRPRPRAARRSPQRLHRLPISARLHAVRPGGRSPGRPSTSSGRTEKKRSPQPVRAEPVEAPFILNGVTNRTALCRAQRQGKPGQQTPRHPPGTHTPVRAELVEAPLFFSGVSIRTAPRQAQGERKDTMLDGDPRPPPSRSPNEKGPPGYAPDDPLPSFARGQGRYAAAPSSSRASLCTSAVAPGSALGS